jgi:HD-GYP domain-containing protein (c-di-GMP phosphodiesterase class II)
MRAGVMSKWIPLEGLKPGMFVSSFDLSWFKHPFVSTRLGVIRDQQLIEELRRLGVRHVQVDPERSAQPGAAPTAAPPTEEQTTRPEARAVVPGNGDAQQEAKELSAAKDGAPGGTSGGTSSQDRSQDYTYADLPPVPLAVDAERTAKFSRKLFEHAMRSTRRLVRGVISGEALDTGELSGLVGHLITSVRTNDDVLNNLLLLKTFDDYTFTHSLNLAALGVLLGESLQMDQKNLELVGMAGILHDVGKCLVPKELIEKPGKLTADEFAVVQGHSMRGYEHLKNQKGLDPLVLRVVLEHHERIDGTGYPNGLSGKAIHPFSSLVSVVDIFDALTSDRVYHGRVSSHTALRTLFGMRDKAFPARIVDVFIKRLGLFPANSVVQLRNGCYAMVSRQIPDHPLHPEVIVFCDANRTPVTRRRVDTSRLCVEMGRKEFEIERNVEPEEVACPFSHSAD